MADDGPKMGLREWALFALCAVLWGSAYIFNKISIAELPHLTITAGRLLLAVLALIVMARITGLKVPLSPSILAPFLIFSMLSNFGPFLLVLHGQTATASGLAAVLGATTPLFTILLAHLFTRDEKITTNKLVGVLAGIAGVTVVVGADAFAGWSMALEAKLSIVAASVLYALGAIYAKRFVHHPPIVIASLQMSAGFIIVGPLAVAIDRPWTLATPSPTAVAAVAGTGILGSALAAVSYFYVFRKAGATNAMLVTLLVPVTPILLGSIFLGERLVQREILGALIIALALIIIDGRLLDRFARLSRMRQ